MSTGVVFPLHEGSRSTSALGRAVVADALRAVDPVGARSVERETDWRHGYLVHFRRLVEAGLVSRSAALTIAREGLASLHSWMRVVRPDGYGEVPLAEALSVGPSVEPDTVIVSGRGTPERDLSVPYRGRRLSADALQRQLDAWVEAGSVEASFAEAVRLVAANPDWLDTSDLRVAVLGAAAEMGPLTSLLRWGGDVVAVDLPRPELWRRLLDIAVRHSGRLHVPVPPGTDESRVTDRAGADLVHRLPDVAAWLAACDGPLVLGNYVYADGATNVRVSAAVDALTVHLQGLRSDLSLAFLGTPTDVFAVPSDVVAEASRRYSERSMLSAVRRPLRLASGGRLLRRNYVAQIPHGTGAAPLEPGVNDSLVPQQGPNYALAKRVQRWRATVARDAGLGVSFAVAPPTRTRSVLKNRVLAAAYAGAHRFGVEVFEPATANTLMAARLVHDLRVGTPQHDEPWRDEAWAAAHGGLWRQPYDPRSVLGLAVLLGWGGARR
jgi:hypothetical protein